MTVLIIILFLIFFILLLPVGGEGEYSEDGFWLKIFFGPISIQAIPAKDMNQNKKAHKSKESKTDGFKKGGDAGMIMDMLPTALSAASAIKSRLTVNKLVIHFVSASEDPCKAAMNFGYASAAIGMILPVFENNFKVKERSLTADVSFSDKKPSVYVDVKISMIVGQLLYIGIKYGLELLKIYNEHSKNTERKAVN